MTTFVTRTFHKEECGIDLFRIDLQTRIGQTVVATIEAYVHDPEPMFIPSDDHADLVQVLDAVSAGALDVAMEFQKAIATGVLDGDDWSRGFVIIERLRVEPAHRGKRLGHALLDALADRTGSDWHVGLKAFPLENDEHRDPAKVDSLAAYYASHDPTSFTRVDGDVLVGRWPARRKTSCTRYRPVHTRYGH